MEEEAKRIENPGIPMLHFSVQFQNVFAAEIIARRFPVDSSTYKPSDIETIVTLEGISIDTATSIAQAILSIQILLKNEPRLFEIAFKQVGLFTYSKDYSPEMVYTFLERGSLSVMLPFARETLIGICNRLQIPAIFLPMVPIISPSISNASEEDVH
jgi:hypothetical protein